jgi:RIO kinase 1
MPRESREEWKIYKNVFDKFTTEIVFKLISQGVIDGLESPLKIGKESNIFTAKAGDKIVVAKIYRLESCNFNKMYDYIKKDSRYVNTKKNRRDIIFAWVQREYRNLLIARQAGVRVPTPLAVNKNVLILDCIGGDFPAQQMKDDLPKNPSEFMEDLMDNLRKLYKAGLVHGDLSEFNILNLDGKPVLIDFSQSTTTKSESALELLKRDSRNIAKFFRKTGIKADEDAIVSAIIK